MPDRERVRNAGIIRITRVVTSADTRAIFTETVRKLLLVETIEERTITEEIEGILAVTVENQTRGTVTVKGATEATSYRSSSDRFRDDYK